MLKALSSNCIYGRNYLSERPKKSFIKIKSEGTKTPTLKQNRGILNFLSTRKNPNKFQWGS